MVISKKMKRLLSLALVCLMLTPIISFATTDNTDTGTEGTDNTTENTTDITDTTDTTDDVVDRTWIDNLTSSSAAAATVDQEKVLAVKEFLNLPYYERQKIALEEAVVATSKEDIDGHSYVCTNGGYELYLNYDNLSVIIRDEETGAVMRSTLSSEEAVAKGYTQTMYDTVTSGVLVKPILFDSSSSGRFGQYSVGNITAVKPEYVEVEELKESGTTVGFVAHLNFTNYGFEFDLTVKLTEEGALSWEVLDGSVKENNSSYLLSELYVFPLLGYTERGDREGYMVLPDGNGITVEYDDYYQDGKSKYRTPYVKQVYGNDEVLSAASSTAGTVGTDIESSRDFRNPSEKVVIPYFGSVYTDTQLAMIGIIDEGEYGAYIEGNINGINNSFENYTTARFVYRTTYVEYTDSVGTSERLKTSEKRMISDIKVTYIFASGDEANYSGLANKLRTHLINNEVINETAKDEFDVRIDFFGVDKENFLVFRRNVVATTADDIRDIVGSLSDLGVTNILAVYEGWQDGGVYNLPIYDFDADSDVGGNSGITQLISDLEEGGTVSLYLMQDMITINTSVTSSMFTSITAYTGKTYEKYEMFNEVYTTFRYLYPSKTEEYIKELVEEFLDNDIKNIGFDGLSNNLFVYTYEKTDYTREDTMGYYENALKSAKEEGMNAILKTPYMYLWKYTDVFLDFSISSSMYVYASEEIPFLSAVLKGTMNLYSEYINFEANSTEHFLKLVETGVYPSFLITKESPAVLQYTNSNWIYSSEYEKYEETIVEYYTKLKEIDDLVNGEYIVSHNKLDSNVSITTYSNGVKIYVNFSDVDVTVDGITIEAESYEYKVGDTE